MSDGDLQISSGGAVVVDSGSLRRAAERFHGEARQLHDIAAALRRSCARLMDVAAEWPGGIPASLSTLDALAVARADGADRIGALLTQTAAVYEVVEQRIAMQQAEAGGDVRAKRLAEARLDALLDADPELAKQADRVVDDYYSRVAEGDRRIGDSVAPAGGVVGGAAGLLVALGRRGRMTRGMTGPAPEPVRVWQVGAVAPGRAPGSLGDVVARIPTGSADERPLARVERYTMPDGSKRFMVYVTGTRNMDLTRTRDPSDMASNVRLYSGGRSPSLAAVQEALTMAGAKSGDVVNPVGHSQGGMIAGRLALDGGYRTTMLVTAGSPTEAQVPRGVLSVQLRHTDDAVPQLTAGGSPARVGSEDSVVISRQSRPGDESTRASTAAAHGLDLYGETARRADASGDIRMRAVDDELAQLRTATAVDVFEYDARLADAVCTSGCEVVGTEAGTKPDTSDPAMLRPHWQPRAR